MKKLLIIVVVFIVCVTTGNFSIAQTQSKIAKDISVQEFNKMIVANPGIILDVRTPGEISKGAIKQSIAIDFFDDDFEAKVEKLDKSKPIYIYCAVGGRSGEAMEMMNKKGFKEVYNLAGGYNAWKKSQPKK